MIEPRATDAEIIFETPKNRVVIFADRVVKTFKPTRRSARHARREVAALRRLQGLEGVPALLDVSADGQTLVMSRVPGVPLAEGATLTDQSLKSLWSLVDQMVARGVARHSLPRRDILVRADGSIGLVDFERSSQRLFAADPVWPVAKVVTRFNILRFVNSHAPHLLTDEEQRWLRRQVRVRASLQYPLKFKRWLFRLIGLSGPKGAPGAPGKRR